ncbi:unnamed protein product, partial [Durusdinium trenchii]
VPKGCFVGVRVGEVLKQRRLDSRSASYTFPKPDTKMNAKIDVYQHVGSGSVVIDPKFFTTDEVSIRCHDVLMQNIRLQVTSQVAQASAEEQCQRRQAAQEENKDAVPLLALKAHFGTGNGDDAARGSALFPSAAHSPHKSQAQDPIEFLCNQLKNSKPKACATS